jgi:acyl transferase domain-containing protein
MALEDAQITSKHLHQVETHGTGTELGDPIETGALRSVLRRDGDRDPVRLGTVKTNVGHLEGGAGMAGLSKLVREHRISMGMEVGSPLMGADLRF